MMDLCENLIPAGGFAHLLIVQCTLSYYLIIIPLRSKTAEVVSKAIFSHVLQLFNVRKIHSDNGPAFRERSFLTLMASMNVKVIASAALHPAGRGMIERRVGIVKMML